MDNLKLLKNFTLSWESMKATLDAFKTGKIVANVTWEVFQVVAPTVANRTTILAPTLALVLVAGGSRSAASRASISAKALASSKSPVAPKSAFKEPIAINESTESGSREAAKVALLDVLPLKAIGGIMIGGAANKRAWTSEPTS